MDKPQTKFTRAGDVAVAYQVVGQGPVDLVYASGWLSNIEIVWEHPGYNKLLSLLSEKCRVILFDKRGTGMSDRDVGAPTLEERTDDIRAVMDAAGSERASIFGVSEGGSMTMMFAAIYPERVSSIILAGCYPCKAWRPDWPHGRRRGEVEADINNIRDNWGEFSDFLGAVAPSVSHDPAELAFVNKLLVQSGSPSTAINITRLNNDLDTRPILSAVQAPALVLHSAGDRTVSLEEAKYMADNMPNAELKVLDRQDHLPWIGDVEEMARKIASFATDFESGPTEDRILAAILMTDIVSSTETTVRLGDAEWRKLIEAHDTAVARSVARNCGTLIKTLGDGILATFTGPSRAVVCAQDIIREAEALGLSVRAGVHIGECVRRGNDIAGVAVTTAARILDSTVGGECRVSSTVRDLVAGSGLLFEAAGSHKLRGIPGDWDLHTAVRS